MRNFTCNTNPIRGSACHLPFLFYLSLGQVKKAAASASVSLIERDRKKRRRRRKEKKKNRLRSFEPTYFILLKEKTSLGAKQQEQQSLTD